MRLKPSVRILGIKPELVLGALIVESCYAAIDVDPVVTVGTEGHRSTHRAGLALDIALPEHGREDLVHAVRDALGPDYEVIYLEDEIHVAFTG